MNFNTEEVIEYTSWEPITVELGTGKYERRMKPNVHFDENTGKFYRQTTLDEIVIEDIPEPQVSDWVLSRIN